MSPKEVASTQVLQVPLDTVSVKVRSAGAGESHDDGEDHGVWAGVVPLRVVAGAPEPSLLSTATRVSPSVLALAARRSAVSAGRPAEAAPQVLARRA